VPLTLSPNTEVEIDDDNGHYVRTVLRLKKDDAIILFNGKGGEYVGVLGEVSRKSVLVNVKSWADRSVESPLQINLGLGISRGDRMDLSVQKAVELGVNRINPIITERCVVQLKEEKAQQRLQHWQKIIQHAAEQSGRTMLPELTEIEAIQDWVRHQSGLKIFLDPYAGQTLAELKLDNMKVTLLTGPEGGFTAQEREIAKAAGFIPVRLGSRILRTETAAIAALAAVQMLWGDFAVAQYESANWEAEK
jgi:16S rRNA (uracil1498-N3)-methyltransferase